MNNDKIKDSYKKIIIAEGETGVEKLRDFFEGEINRLNNGYLNSEEYLHIISEIALLKFSAKSNNNATLNDVVVDKVFEVLLYQRHQLKNLQ